MVSTVSDHEIADEAVSLARPWPRFWAKLVDIGILSWPVGLCLGLVFPDLFASMSREASAAANLKIGILVLPLVLLADAAINAATGSSIGKGLAGIKIQTELGKNPSMETAIKRNILLWVKGLVFGIPLLSLIGYSSGYQDVQSHGSTSWDRDTSTQVIDVSNNGARTAMTAVLALIVTAIGNAAGKM